MFRHSRLKLGEGCVFSGLGSAITLPIIILHKGSIVEPVILPTGASLERKAGLTP